MQDTKPDIDMNLMEQAAIKKQLNAKKETLESYTQKIAREEQA
jgi:hypothetical protein